MPSTRSKAGPRTRANIGGSDRSESSELGHLMQNKYGMESPAGRGFCDQIFKPGKGARDHVYIPGTLTSYSAASQGSGAGPHGIKPHVIPGVSTSVSTSYAVQTSFTTGNGLFMVNLDLLGFNDRVNLIYTGSTGGAWTGTALPVATGTGLSTEALGASQLPYSETSIRGERNALTTGLSLKITSTDSNAMNRQGTVIAGFLDENAAQSIATLRGYPGMQPYSLQLLDPGQEVESLMPPESYQVCDSIASDTTSWTNSSAGWLFILINNAYHNGTTEAAVFNISVDMDVFNWGTLIPSNCDPIFSSVGFDCVRTCFNQIMGHTVSDRKSVV